MFGTTWTKNGQYNWAKYIKGDKIEALPGTPPAHTNYAVWWYPGKPTLGCCLRDNQDALTALYQLEQLPAQGQIVISQEPILNGAWWVGRKGKRLAGPYDWDTACRIAKALCEARA